MSNTQIIETKSAEDTSGLILTHLTSSSARNAVEAESISRAYDKHIFRARRKNSASKWLTDNLICKVHADMFADIWNWGGQFRKIQLLVGAAPQDIHDQISLLSRDFLSWNHTSTMPVLELAARLQHRLIYIRPFINGNGRLARLLTDIFFYSRQHHLPEWPQIQLMTRGNDVRVYYMTAMRQADEGNFTTLMTFIEDCLPQANQNL
ncbi:MAG: mobile mystery protein B [Nitrospirales bacterium]